jgi:hypothetical protein
MYSFRFVNFRLNLGAAPARLSVLAARSTHASLEVLGTAQKQLPRLTAGPTARAADGTPSLLGLGLNDQTEMLKAL